MLAASRSWERQGPPLGPSAGPRLRLQTPGPPTWRALTSVGGSWLQKPQAVSSLLAHSLCPSPGHWVAGFRWIHLIARMSLSGLHFSRMENGEQGNQESLSWQVTELDSCQERRVMPGVTSPLLAPLAHLPAKSICSQAPHLCQVSGAVAALGEGTCGWLLAQKGSLCT